MVRDVVIGDVAAFEALAYLAHRSSEPVRFMLALLPQEDDDFAYETLRRTFTDGTQIPNGI